MSQSDSVPCGIPTCEKNVTKKTGGISCSKCQVWFHLTCVKVTSEEVNFLSKSKGKFVYECANCTGAVPEPAGLKNEVRSLNTNIQSLNAKMDALIGKVGNYDEQFQNLGAEVTNCNKLIKHVDDTTSNKIKLLEDKNEILQKRFNKLDIIVNGLAREKINIKETVHKIFNCLDVNVDEKDINTCCYINNRYSVLLKFNFLSKRDEIMRNYFKKATLFEGDFLKNGSKKRIYLNDHLTEKGAKLCRLCRGLRNDKIIAKFRILNSDLPRVKIHFKNSSEKIFDYDECFSYFENVERQQSTREPHINGNSANMTGNAVVNATINNNLSTDDVLASTTYANTSDVNENQ